MTGPKRYRKKPVEIDAMQWDGTAAGATPIIDWVLANGATARFDEPHEEIRHELDDGTVQGCPASPGGVFIDTLEGTMRADAGDWIIRGVQGEFYPCKPDIFAETYDEPEAVDPVLALRRAEQRLIEAKEHLARSNRTSTT